ncbi:MAG: ATP-grasp domain-containing protein [Acidimicrobiales bacterium]
MSPHDGPTVGIVGGGQLAQMLHQAAISLDVATVVLCPDGDAPAVRAGARHLAGHPDRLDDLLALARCTDVLTLDHEHVPTHLLAELEAAGHRVAPGPQAAALGRDKAQARDALRGLVPVAPWARLGDLRAAEAAHGPDDHDDPSGQADGEPGDLDLDPAALAAARFAERHGWPVVLKATSGGYDGRGVWVARSPRELRRALADAGAASLMVEAHVTCAHELAVLVVRSPRGEVASYPTVETVQRDGCCAEVLVPAPVDPALAARAEAMARTVADAIGLVGVMAVELFATAEGDLLLNELATRPHNSGHLTIEACATSQFENHLRAVLDLPLGATDLRVPAAAMANVVAGPDGADPFDRWAEALSVPGASVHRYGKASRPGRKLGHITAVGPTVEAARAIANGALRSLEPRRAA